MIHVKDILNDCWLTVVKSLDNTSIRCYSRIKDKALVIQDPQGETTMVSALWGNMQTYNGTTIVIQKNNYNVIL